MSGVVWEQFWSSAIGKKKRLERENKGEREKNFFFFFFSTTPIPSPQVSQYKVSPKRTFFPTFSFGTACDS